MIHPYWALGAAAGVGLLAGGLLRRRRTPEVRLLEAAASSLEALADRLRVPTDSRQPASRVRAARLFRNVLGVWFSWALRRRLTRREALFPAGVREPA